VSGDVTMKVEGLRELERTIAAFPKEMPGVIAKAQKTPMEKVLADAKALVNANSRRYGLLHDALSLVTARASASRASSAVDALAYVGIRIKRIKTGLTGSRGGMINPRSYWHLVEFGTSHSAAEPYLRPAFDQNTDHMIGTFKSICSEQIERIIARYARKRRRR
jgi:HK97 gp10 family phage protein